MRFVVNTKKHHYVGYEFIVPDTQRVDGITTYYEIQILHRPGPKKRRLYLEMSELVGKYHVLRETYDNGGGAQLIPYGEKKPDLKKVMTDLVALVEPPKPDKKSETRTRSIFTSEGVVNRSISELTFAHNPSRAKMSDCI